jgi:hypothetical protein
VLLVWADAADVRLTEGDSTAEIEAVPPLAVSFIPLKADKRERADVGWLNSLLKKSIC